MAILAIVGGVLSLPKQLKEAKQVVTDRDGDAPRILEAEIRDAATKAYPPADPCREDVPGEAAALVEKAVRSMGKRNYQQAAESLRNALEIAPDYAMARSVRGFLEMERGRYTAARESFARAVEEFPECPAHQFNLGSFHLSRGEYGEAERHLNRSLDLDPSHLPTAAALGRAYLLHGAPESAREVLEEGLRRAERVQTPLERETLYSLHANLGRTALELGRSGEALKHLERASHLVRPEDTRFPEIVADLAGARVADGRAGEACAELARLLPLGRDPHLPGESEAVALARRLDCTDGQ